MLVTEDTNTNRTMVMATERNDFVAVKNNGKWTRGPLFDADDLKDNFERVKDQTRAETIYSEAVAALTPEPAARGA